MRSIPLLVGAFMGAVGCMAKSAAALPDLVLEWAVDGGCQPGEQVRFTVTPFDPALGEVTGDETTGTIACEIIRSTLFDVPADHLMIEATLLDDGGVARAHGRGIADTRAGDDRRGIDLVAGRAFVTVSTPTRDVTQCQANPFASQAWFIRPESQHTFWAGCGTPEVAELEPDTYSFVIIARDLDNNIFERSAVQRVTLGAPGDHVLVPLIPLVPCTEPSCGDPPPLP